MKRLFFLILTLLLLSPVFAQPVWTRDTICKGNGFSYKVIYTRNNVKPNLWEWTMTGGVPSSHSSTTDSTTPPIFFHNAGTFYVVTKMSYPDGTDTTIQAEVFVLDPAPPANTLGNDTSYCGNFSHTLHAGNIPSTYLWSPNGETSESITVTQPGIYSVDVSNKCYSGTFSITLNQSQLPNVNLGPDGFVCNEDPKILSAGNSGSTYLWTPGNLSTQTYKVEKAGTYRVEVTNADGCSSFDEIILKDSCPPDLYIPTAFSPNDDEMNDTLTPYINGISKIKFGIYNRWGAELFYTEKLNHGWDGNFNGSPVSDGLYIWMIHAHDSNGNKIIKKGVFLLLR